MDHIKSALWALVATLFLMITLVASPLAPLPLFFFAKKNSLKSLAPLLVLGGVFTLMGSGLALLFTLVGAVSFLWLFLEEKKVSWLRALAITVVLLVGLTGGLLYFYHMQRPLHEWALTFFKNALEKIPQKQSPAFFIAIKGVVDILMDPKQLRNLYYGLPLSLIISSFTFSWVGLFFIGKIQEGSSAFSGWSLQQLREYRPSPYLIYGLMGGLAFYLVGDRFFDPQYSQAMSFSLIRIFALFYYLAGAGVILVFVKNKVENTFFARLLTYGGIFFFPQTAAILGLLDFWLNLRAKYSKKSTKRDEEPS